MMGVHQGEIALINSFGKKGMCIFHPKANGPHEPWMESEYIFHILVAFYIYAVLSIRAKKATIFFWGGENELPFGGKSEAINGLNVVGNKKYEEKAAMKQQKREGRST